MVARLWLVPHDGVFYLVPVFALAATFFGWSTALVAARLLDAELAPAAPLRDGRRREVCRQADGGPGEPVGVRVAVAGHPFQPHRREARQQGEGAVDEADQPRYCGVRLARR